MGRMVSRFRALSRRSEMMRAQAKWRGADNGVSQTIYRFSSGKVLRNRSKKRTQVSRSTTEKWNSAWLAGIISRNGVESGRSRTGTPPPFHFTPRTSVCMIVKHLSKNWCCYRDVGQTQVFLSGKAQKRQPNRTVRMKNSSFHYYCSLTGHSEKKRQSEREHAELLDDLAHLCHFSVR